MIQFDIDELQLYVGGDYVINENIIIKQPNLRQIVEFGEANFFSMVHTIVAIPSDMKASLWDSGLDWNDVEDFELFMLLAPSLTPDLTSILFGDLDFSKFVPIKNKQNGDIVLVDIENEIMIDKLIYMRIVSYICKAFGIKQKVEKAANKITKQVLIDEDRAKMAQNKDKPFKSYLLPLISAVKVKQGYTKDYVLNMGFVEFFDDVARLQIINNADHLLNGIYAGTIDSKKLDKQEINWMRELDSKN